MHLCAETKNQDGLWGFVQSVSELARASFMPALL